MDIKELKKTWDWWGKKDPLWAVLTLPGKEGGHWDPEEFFASGRTEVDAFLDSIPSELRRRRALDFGCGVGRLTQALAGHFERVDGVDISDSMIEHARRYNRHGEKCRYHVNPAADLKLFGDDVFDLVFSIITLHHVEPELAVGYIREFHRVLTPGGLMLFEVPTPSRRVKPLGRLRQAIRDRLPTPLLRLLRRVRGQDPDSLLIEVFGVEQADVEAVIAECGGTLLRTDEEPSGAEFVKVTYLVTK